MLVRNALKLGSLLFALKVLDQLLLGKVKFRSVILDAKYLRGLLTEPDFVAFYLSNEYVEKLGNDSVRFLGYVKRSGQQAQMEPVNIDTDKRGPERDKDRLKYSTYNLDKDDITSLTAAYPEAFYFLLEPVPYAGDREYISFKITPLDQGGNPIGRKKRSRLQSADTGVEEAPGAPVMHAARRNEAEGENGEAIGMLNPSPPATFSFESNF